MPYWSVWSAGTSSTATHVAADLAMGIDHLFQAARMGEDQVVGEQDGERLVGQEVAGAPHRVAEPHRHLLAGVGDVARRGHPVENRTQGLGLAAFEQHVLQLDAVIEMVLDRALGAAGDEDELLDAGVDRLLDGILNQWLVDDGQHFLRHRLGRREEAGTEAGDRKHRLANGFRHQ